MAIKPLERIDISNSQSALEYKFDQMMCGMTGMLGSEIYDGPKVGIINDTVNGGEYWREFATSCEAYYLYKDEPELINDAQSKLQAIIGDAKCFVDLGPGSKESVLLKTLPILSCAKGFNKYIPVDISLDFVEDACSEIKRHYPSVQVEGHAFDFQADNFPLLFNQDKKAIIYLGSTLSNAWGLPNQKLEDNKDVIRQFNNFRKLAQKGGYMLLTHDANQDRDSILTSYNHPKLRALILNVFDKIKRDTRNHGFDPKAFIYESVWNPENSVLAHTVIATKAQNFSLGGKEYKIPRGQRLVPVNSFKPKLQTIKIICERSGWQIIESFACKHGRLMFQVLQAI